MKTPKRTDSLYDELFADNLYTQWHGQRDFVRSVKNRTDPLHITPHYSDYRFNQAAGWRARTVFGPETHKDGTIPGLSYVYSDRLEQWDYRKHSTAWDKAADSGAPLKSAAFLERYLSEYYEKPITLVHVLAGVNCSNGYSYWVAGYRETKTEDQPKTQADG